MIKKNKLLIDGLMLLSPFTGIAKYTYENSKRIEIDNTDIYFYYGYFSPNIIGSDSSKKYKKSFLKKLKSLIIKNKYIKKFVRTVILKHITPFYQEEFDLFWEPNHLSNTKIKARYRVTTVHDLSFHIHPEWHPKERVEYFEKHFWNEIITSDRIITGSKYSKKELLNYIKFDTDKIDVIYHGVDLDNFKVYSKNILEDFSKKYSIEKKFILSVGSIEPRKNLISLLQAYQNLTPRLKDEYSLILVGFKGWQNSEIMSIIDAEKENIRYLGYLEDVELAYIYNLATLFCFPSYYEGFGIPPLEAMACGTPVVLSNTTSMPEVGAEAVIYCNPYDVNSIKEKIELLLTDEKLQYELANKGLLHVKQFTWEESAQKHKEIFNKVLQQ